MTLKESTGQPSPAGARRDQDEGKGAVEDDTVTLKSNAPALDANGMPNDLKKIAEVAAGAREDKTQG